MVELFLDEESVEVQIFLGLLEPRRRRRHKRLFKGASKFYLAEKHNKLGRRRLPDRHQKRQKKKKK